MNKILFTLFGSLLFLSPCWGGGSFETWHDIRGRSFEAEIVSVSPGLVRLRNREGKEVDFPTPQLLADDQLRVIAWEKAAKTAVETTDFVKYFEDDLLVLKGSKLMGYDPETLGQVKYFAFYRSASWCGPCRKFTPELVRFYARMKRSHPEFEVIFVSSDRSEDDMKKYMEDDEMAWPAFKFRENRNLVTSYGNGIPCLIVTDADGKKLLDSYSKDGTYLGAASVMRDLEKLLKE